MKAIKKCLSVILALTIITSILCIIPIEVEATSNNSSNWKEKYIEYINDRSSTSSNMSFALIDLDGNGIPELLFDSGTYLGGKTLSGITKGEINTVIIGGAVFRLGNLVYCYTGQMGIYRKIVYEINNGSIECLFDGIQTAKNITDFNMDNPDDFIYSHRYRLSDDYSKISYNEFNRLLSAVFDEKKAQKIEFQYNSSSIINAINNYQTVTDWKQLYTNYLNQSYPSHSRHAVPEYALAQINNDDTPELILRATDGAGYVDHLYYLIWISDGQLMVEKQGVEKYNPKTGKFYSIGRGTVASHIFDGEKIQTVHTATWYGNYIAVDGNNVDQDTYQSFANDIYQYGNQSLEYKSKEQILKDIYEYNVLGYDLTQLDEEILCFDKYRAKYYSENASFISDAYMTYKEIENNYSPTAHAINLALSFGWEAKFNFSDSSQIWETIILDILLRNGSADKSISDTEKTAGEVFKNLRDFIQDNNIGDAKLPIQKNSKESLKNIFKETANSFKVDTSDILDEIDSAMDVAETLGDFLDKYSKYISIYNSLGNNVKQFISEMKSTSVYRDTPAFKRAIDRIDLNFSIDGVLLFADVFGRTVFSHAFTKCLNNLVGGIVKATLGPKIFALVEFTKAGTILLMDAIIGTGNIAKNNIYVYIVDRIDDAASEAFNTVTAKCKASGGEQCYQSVLGGYAFFDSLYSYGIDLCLKWTDEITSNIITKVTGDDYTHVKKPYYDIANDYLNLNHSSSNQEKRQYVYSKIKDDEKWVDQCLHNLPAFSFLDWNANYSGSSGNSQCIVMFHVENPSGGHTLYVTTVDKGSSFKAPDFPAKNGYNKPSLWYSDRSYTQRILNSTIIQQNTCYYSRYSPAINYKKTDDNTGITILKISGSNTSSDSVGAPVDSAYVSGNKYKIPSFIEGYAVKELGEDIFENYSDITELSLPSSIIIINKGAFNSLSASTKYIAVNGSAVEQFLEDNNFANILISGKVGDTNLDGYVNGADAGVLARYTSGWKNYADKIEKMDTADINGDSKVNGADAGVLSRYVSGWMQYAKYFVTVKPVGADSITISKSSLSLNVDETYQLNATINPSNTMDKNVTWTSSNTTVATVNNGMVNAKSKGTAVITAKTVNGKTATCNVTVNQMPTGITINYSSKTLNVGDSFKLTATISPSNTDDKTVTWTSSNTTVATVSNGTVTAKSKGTAVITAKTVNGKTATCSITVNPIVPESVSLNKNHIELDTNQELSLTATVYPSNAEDKSVTWISGDTSILTVSETGKIQALSNGKTNVTVKTANGKTAVCEVEVYQPISGSLSLTLFMTREPNGYARLTKDITVNSLLPICDTEFKGCLNGDNHTITYDYSGSTNNATKDVCIALFAKSNGAIIKNIKTAGSIENTVNSNSFCGNCCAGLVANAQNTVFENCENNAKIKGAFWGSDSAYGLTGGITALSYNCEFIGCSNSGELVCFTYSKKESISSVGGISGQSNNCKYIECNNTGTLFPQALLDECENPEICSAVSGGIAGVVENSIFSYCNSNGKLGALIWPKNTTQLESFAASGGIAGTGNATFIICSSNSELLPTVNGIGKSYKDDILAIERY